MMINSKRLISCADRVLVSGALETHTMKDVHEMLTRQLIICTSDTVREDEEREMNQYINGQAEEQTPILRYSSYS